MRTLSLLMSVLGRTRQGESPVARLRKDKNQRTEGWPLGSHSIAASVRLFMSSRSSQMSCSWISNMTFISCLFTARAAFSATAVLSNRSTSVFYWEMCYAQLKWSPVLTTSASMPYRATRTHPSQGAAPVGRLNLRPGCTVQVADIGRRISLSTLMRDCGRLDELDLPIPTAKFGPLGVPVQLHIVIPHSIGHHRSPAL